MRVHVGNVPWSQTEPNDVRHFFAPLQAEISLQFHCLGTLVEENPLSEVVSVMEETVDVVALLTTSDDEEGSLCFVFC